MPEAGAGASTFRYQRGKALLFGLLPIALAGLMLWVGYEALDPAWTARVTRGQFLVDAPFWVRAPVIIGTALVLLVPGLWLLWAGLAGVSIVVADGQRISARTLFGRHRSLAWSEIVAARRKKNQLVLSPAGTDTLGQEIWDRKSVLLDAGMLDAPPAALEQLVLRHRPDLAFRDVK